jgi:hypothetical protein
MLLGCKLTAVGITLYCDVIGLQVDSFGYYVYIVTVGEMETDSVARIRAN